MENIFILLVLLICCHLVPAQFPIECRSNSSDHLSQGSGVCCPMFNNKVCGGSQRGQCLNINTTCRIPGDNNSEHWLRGYFSKMCVCRDKFYGVACEECWYGLTPSNDGQSCIASNKSRTRYNYLKLTRVEQEYFLQVLLLMKTTPSNFYIVGSNSSSAISIYDYLSALHFITMMKNWTNLAHNGPGFPTWHRAYLLLFERLAQKVSGNHTFSLPYVNEYSEEDIQKTVDLLGGDGINIDDCHVDSVVGRNCSCSLSRISVFSTWQEISLHGMLGNNISRALGCLRTSTNPPSKSTFDYAIQQSKYSEPPWDNNETLTTFSNLLEGFALAPEKVRTEPGDVINPRDTHNRLHFYIGGTMSRVETAASDPFFWLHHAFIDWMLEKWMENHQTSMGGWTTTDAADGHNYKDCQGSLIPLYGHDKFFLNSVTYGYTYNSLTSTPGKSLSSINTGAIILGCALSAAVIVIIVLGAMLYRARRQLKNSPEQTNLLPMKTN